MTKTLTEQWRNGTLPLNHYYVERKTGSVFIDNTVVHFDERIPFARLHWEEDIKEVLAPVPTYDQFSQLVKKVEQLEEANKLLLDFKSEYPCCFDHQGYCQVHDSCDGDYKCIQKDLKLYFERYGVK